MTECYGCKKLISPHTWGMVTMDGSIYPPENDIIQVDLCPAAASGSHFVSYHFKCAPIGYQNAMITLSYVDIETLLSLINKPILKLTDDDRKHINILNIRFKHLLKNFKTRLGVSETQEINALKELEEYMKWAPDHVEYKTPELYPDDYDSEKLKAIYDRTVDQHVENGLKVAEKMKGNSNESR